MSLSDWWLQLNKDSWLCGFLNSSTGLGRIAILSVHCTDKIILNTSAKNAAFISSPLKNNPSVTFSLPLYKNTTVTLWNYPAHHSKDWDRGKRLQVGSWTDTYGSSLVFGEGSKFDPSIWREGEWKPQSSYFNLKVVNKKINFNLEATGFKTTRGTNETSPLAINWKLSKATKSSNVKHMQQLRFYFPSISLKLNSRSL